MKKIMLFMSALMIGALTLTSCNDDDSNEKKKDLRKAGNEAIAACTDLSLKLEAANAKIAGSKLSEEQEAEVRSILGQLVDDVIVPTYTDLADDAEALQKALNDLDASSITQNDVDKACSIFKRARQHWERSEAFLMGPASDFDIDPTIDSWPLNRTMLVAYLKSGSFTEEQLDDASILGFHALEFILFRNGANRKVEEFTGNDTYKGFEGISGASELAYAQKICELLVERTYQLQVAWEGSTSKNADRVAKVEAAGLSYTTKKGYSYGENLKNAGNADISTFPSLKDAVAQVLSDDEGSCLAICDEVGGAKIANPFQYGYVFYVESPFSYNSITDFQDNIRSIRNVWLGSLDGTTGFHSFKKFFAANASVAGGEVEDAYEKAIKKIGDMPFPFVSYVSKIWGVAYEDDEVEGIEE